MHLQTTRTNLSEELGVFRGRRPQADRRIVTEVFSNPRSGLLERLDKMWVRAERDPHVQIFNSQIIADQRGEVSVLNSWDRRTDRDCYAGRSNQHASKLNDLCSEGRRLTTETCNLATQR